MKTELSISTISFDDSDIGTANRVSEVMSHFVELNPHDRRYFETFARGLLHLKAGKPTKAKRVFESLSRFNDFDKFREHNADALKTIKLLVDGNTHRF